MDQEAKNKIDEALMALRAMLRGGSITDDIYNKAAIGLAYEYAQGAEMGEALAIVNSIPLEYYQGPQEQQMREDANYQKVAVEFSKLLVQYVTSDMPLPEVSEGWSFTQKPAKA